MSNILQKIIESKQSCLIIPHQSPDGDCLGSSFALSNFLTNNGCEHYVILDDVVPTNYLFLKTDRMITSKQALTLNKTFDYTIILDTSSPDRVGALKEVVDLGAHKIVIDHHKTNSYFGDTNIVEMVSSVGELLYNLFEEVGYKITETDAIGLYTSIVTDTGEFRYSNTSSETLKVASVLYETGFDFENISREIFSNQPLNKVLLKSKALAEMSMYADGKVTIMKVTQAMIHDLKCEMFHSDGIVEAGRDIEDVEVSILLKEIDEQTVKVSMRSKSYLDVSDVSLVFNGGGHSRAAGCTVNENIQLTEDIIVKEIKKRL